MLNQKYVVRKNVANKFYDVKDATEILSVWGISHNEKKTRDLIAKGKLNARSRGTDPNDRRSGYEVSEKAIYDLVTHEIPYLKEVFDFLSHVSKQNEQLSKEVKILQKELEKHSGQAVSK